MRKVFTSFPLIKRKNLELIVLPHTLSEIDVLELSLGKRNVSVENIKI